MSSTRLALPSWASHCSPLHAAKPKTRKSVSDHLQSSHVLRDPKVRIIALDNLVALSMVATMSSDASNGHLKASLYQNDQLKQDHLLPHHASHLGKTLLLSTVGRAGHSCQLRGPYTHCVQLCHTITQSTHKSPSPQSNALASSS
jgi:hypothetical protein